MRLAMARPRPVPLALVVKNGSKIFARCSAGDARAVIVHGDAHGGLAVELDRGGADVDRDGRRAGGQGVVEEIAEDLVETERVAGAVEVDAIERFVEERLLVLAGLLEVGPGFTPDRAQIAGYLLELDRGGVAANVFVEMVEVVLRLLEPADQVERLRAITDPQGEHLETRLAALQVRCGFRAPAR